MFNMNGPTSSPPANDNPWQLAGPPGSRYHVEYQPVNKRYRGDVPEQEQGHEREQLTKSVVRVVTKKDPAYARHVSLISISKFQTTQYPMAR